MAPAGALLLLRRYLRSGDAVFRDAVSCALAQGVEASAFEPLWIEPLAEAAAFADDDRVLEAVDRTAAALLAPQQHALPVADAMRRIDAGFRATALVPNQGLLESAVDQLEAIVGRSYEPGAGVGASSRAGEIWTATALLSGYAVTGRLPYAMLAEELVRFAQSAESNTTTPELSDAAAFARVLLGLAALHRDPDYRHAAVIAPDADYDAAAGRLLDRYAVRGRNAGADAALYALAVDEYLAARDLQ